jgi:hypothetical protein
MLSSRLAFRLLLLATLCLSTLVSARAQSATATLGGMVVDQNGALVASASVTATNTATGLERRASTSDNGTFTIPLLPPSTYTLLVEHEGFATARVSEVVLNVGDQKALKIQLKAGEVTETVQVTSEAPLIDESPAVSTVVDRQFVENLPLNGRSFQSLITLTPGVLITGTSYSNQGQFSVNGQRADANYFTVDGVSANFGVARGATIGQSGGGSLPALTAGGGTNGLVSVDALQEFQIQTSTFAPEFGRSPGGQISIVTRSGTNRFSGSLFDYVRNDVFDANDWFANANRLKKPPLRQNDFGFVIGGPVLLPRFGEGGHQPFYNGRDRTFFFFSYEGLRLRQPVVSIVSVPSLASRRAAPPAVQTLFNAFPLPNGPDLAAGLAQFAGSYSNPSTLNASSIRIDHTVAESLTLFGRFNYAPSLNIQRSGSLSTLTSIPSNITTLTIGATHVLNPNLTNEIRGNYSRNKAAFIQSLDSFGGAVPPPDSALFPPFVSFNDALYSFRIGVTAFTAGTQNENVLRQYNLVDNLAYVTGTHQMKFGVDYRHLSSLIGLLKYQQSYSFSSIAQAISGVVGFGGVLSTKPVNNEFVNLSLYGQDTWRISRRLTLTYGMRWDVNPPPKGKGDIDVRTVTGLDNPATFALAPPGTQLYETTYNNFAPRMGVAYQLSQKAGREAVLRGGFGVFYDFGTGQLSDVGTGAPNTGIRFLSNTPFPPAAASITPPPFGVPPFLSIVAVPNLKTPYTYQMNVAIEQSLGANQTFTASYVGALGRRLLRQEVFFSPNPSFSQVFVTKNGDTSDYHSMQLQYNRRLAHGLQTLVSYTWAHSIDTASSNVLILSPTTRIEPKQDRGASDFDVRHALNGAITYNVPTPPLGKVVSAIFRNFAVDTRFTARSATPVNVTYSRNIGFGFYSFRPDLVPGIPIYVDDPTAPGGKIFNNARVTIPGNPNPQIGPFLRPVEARQGTLGRNVVRGFPVYQVDLALRRQFNLTERMNLQLRAEAFNIFNHPNFANQIGTLTSSLFGRSTSMLGRALGSDGLTGGFSPLYQIGGPRSLQFALKLNF